ncbi:Fatty acyl reductase, partial [Operophtera brumata]
SRKNLIKNGGTSRSGRFFTPGSWVFRSPNASTLHASLSPTDQDLFAFNPEDIEWKSYVEQYSRGIRKYLLFKLLHTTNPNASKKIVPVVGDVTLPNLGINPQVEEILRENAFVYISTAFSNCNRTVVDEVVYPPPMPLDEVYKLMEQDYSAEELKKHFTITLHRFSVKAIAKEPLPGWLENWFGATRVANKEVTVYHNCSSSVNPISYEDFFTVFSEETARNGSNEMYAKFWFLKSKPLVEILSFFFETTPANVADFWLMLTGRSPKYVKNLSRAKQLCASLGFFLDSSWVFLSRNTSSLHESLTPNEQIIFPCDPADIDWKPYLEQYSQGVRKYLLGPDQIRCRL